MMSLSANMDLRNLKIKDLAKANVSFELFIPPDKSRGNLDGGNSINRNGFQPILNKTNHKMALAKL
jgi:hypothetical protein